MERTKTLAGIAAASAGLLAAAPALAHHPLGGLPMDTFAQGLASGVGHPVLGFDHLFFVALVGIAAAFTAARLTAPLAYLGAMLAGCALMAAGVALPLAEAAIAVSLLALGAVVLSGRAVALPGLLALFAGFGLFHGSAFGTALTGADGGAGAGVLAGYLIGLAAVQYAIALAAGWIVREGLGAGVRGAMPARLAGAAVAGVGLFLVLEAVEGPMLGLVFGV